MEPAKISSPVPARVAARGALWRVSVAVFMLSAGAVRAQTLMDIGTTVPTPGAHDISQLSALGNEINPDNLNYYTDNAIGNPPEGEPGQTFTTGSDLATYTLNTLAIQTAGLDSSSDFNTPQDYYLHFYSVSVGTATLIQTYESAPFTFTDGDWLLWSNLSVALAPNATYAYSFGRTRSGTGWVAMGVSSGAPYAGGELGMFPVAGGAITFGPGFDAIFDLGFAGSPLTSAPSVSPTNNPVYAGTLVTLAEAAVGGSPLYYCWQTDGGSGGTHTNIPGATLSNLTVDTTGFSAGAYNYDVVVTNAIGASTSAVAVLNVAAASLPFVVSDITPASALAYVARPQTFSASFDGTLPISYQWQANTGGGYTNIPGATNTSLTLANLQPADAGTYRLLAANSVGGPVMSSPASLSVLDIPFVSAVLADQPVAYWRLNETGDTSSGTLVAADVMQTFNGVFGSASADDIPGPTPSLGFAGFEAHNTGAQFTNGVPNSFVTVPALNLNTDAVTITAWIYPIGTPAEAAGLVFCRTDGDASGLNFGADGRLGYAWNQNSADTYGWNSGLAPPLQQWSFVALVISPASAIIYLCNTNGTQSATNAIAHTAEAFNTTTLIGGDTADGGGGGRTFNGIMDEVAIFATSLTAGQVASLYDSAAPAPSVTLPTVSPSNNVFAGVPVTLSASVGGMTPLSMQWQFNSGGGFANIPGANDSTLTFSAEITNTGLYELVVTNNYGAVTTAPVALTVTLDTTPPAVLSAVNVGSTNVLLVFSKMLDPVTSTEAANYAFTNGAAITGASLGADSRTVTLVTAPLIYGSNYTLLINGVLDQTIPPNTIAANTAIRFTAFPFAPQDIGNPPVASTVTFTTNGATASSAGYNIGGNSDQFSFEYQLQDGDFDVTVRLAGLGLSDIWAEAGLMARASLDPGSPFAAALATPGMVGDFFSDRAAGNAPAVTSGSFPANYPNTWLRLNRVGNVFTGFGGYDGTNWTPLGVVAIAMSDPIYLGLAVASHNTNQPATAQFVDYETTPANAVVAAIVNPHEPIGPSSRKTGMVISEIMWKPAPRADGNNVEFLEIYNSCPFFQDISGYTMTCTDMNYTFPTNTLIPGGAYFVLAASPQSIANVYGLTSNVFGPYNGSLKHSETLELLDEHGNVLLTAPYNDTYPWPVAADGTGHSIVLANPTYGEGDPRAWDISDTVGGSPGQADTFHPSPLRSVVINEILPHSENPAVPQFIELYNHSANRVDVSGCILTDDPTTNKFVIPSGTVIGPAGFVSFTQSQFGFTLNGQGETLYFIKPDGSRILDAVQFGAQADGVSYGRWPDGANDFYAFATNTPGTNNAPILIGDIVINELMYDPITSDDFQYIELYNKGTNTISLAGWQFTAGVIFTFPTNAVIGPNGYVVAGKDIATLFANYTNLNAANTFGNYSGKLSHNGELVALSQPESYFGTNTIYVEEDEVTYGTGGRWGEWSGGGGSSLELIDPHSNHRLAANWADSDETQKSVWVDIENTGVLDNGASYDPSIDYAQIGLLDAGECLVDDIEVDFNGSNYVSNGTFENGLGLTNWSLQGCMVRSSLEPGGYQSSYSLHIRSSDRLWTGDNSCQVALQPNTMQAGQTATLRFKARWLRGWPEALLRLNGNSLEATAAMPVPSNLGSPGAPNSRHITNAGPALYNVTHTPSLPAANQAAVVTVQAHDPDGITNLTLYYRLDPSTNYTAVPMNDSGTDGDAIAGDGVFSATIPGQAANHVVAFYISAADSLGAATCFPAIRASDNEPVRECMVMFGDGNPGGSFGVYHLWITQTNVTRWANLSDLSNEGNDCTFVNDTRVIYNMQGHFQGSPFHQLFDTPDGNLCQYKWEFNDDDKFLGATDFNKIHQPGNAPGDDASLQREQLANSFLRALGVPWLYKRYAVVLVNGNRRGYVMEDTQVPGSDIVKEYFPNDTDGFLYKMQPWLEFAPFLSYDIMYFDVDSWCTLMPYTTTGGVKKPARYRYSFEIRRTPGSDSDFTNVFSLVDAASSYGTPNYEANMENLADMENWMRVFAANHAAGNWDCYGAQNAQNLYGYIGTQGAKYSLLMWDFNLVIGNSESWGPGQQLFTVNSQDPNTQNIYNDPAFRRMYWRALQELVNGPLDVANSGPLLMAKYNAFAGNGFSVENPTANIEPWLSQAQSSIATQLAAVNAANFTVNPGVTLSNNVAYVSGQAPVNVAGVLINGAAWPLTWRNLTGWIVAVPLANGANNLSVVGVDHNGQPIAGTSNRLAVTYNGVIPPPAGQVVINEIMYNPAIPGAQFVELFNTSASLGFDLSGWQIPGLNYTFAPGASIAPNGFLVLAANGAAFASAYGATHPVFDTFGENVLETNGATLLVLEQSGGGVVAQVQFSSAPPWPAGANGQGASLQLIDPAQDNWREGNWAAAMPAPDATNLTQSSLPPFPPLWINEVEPDNINGITNRAGQHAPWLELYNPSTTNVALTGLCLTGDYSDLTNWAFPDGAVIASGQFLVIFADGQTSLSTLSELHTSFSLPPASGSIALSRLYDGQPQVLDYVDYTNIPANFSYGSFPDGQSFNRQVFASSTPGGTNNGSVPDAVPYVAIGSLYTQNFDSLPNPGATTVNTANPVTINGVTYSLENPISFADPVSASAPGGLGLGNTMFGWYGSASLTMKAGASAGDQSTGGIISFGPTDRAATNRALGLLATSTTGPTAFGLKLLNGTTNILNLMSLSFAGELWRQEPNPKTLAFSTLVDLTGTSSFSTSGGAALPALNVAFPTAAYSPLDGTQPANQVFLSVTNQPINAWPPGAALWLIWQMASGAGTSQGLAIDNLVFSANTTDLPPGIATQPQSQTVNSGNNPVFTVTGASPFPLRYQWQMDATNLPGATNRSLLLTDVSAGDQGTYQVIVSNPYGATNSAPATLTVNLVTGLPVINTQPQSQTNSAGATSVFTVQASGAPPLAYQWQFDGGPITDATNFTLTLAGLGATNQGTYSVLVSDSSGTTPSQDASLTVLLPPSILTQPASQTVPAGAVVTLSVAAIGGMPLSYQWFLNNTPLSNGGAFTGSATSNLTISGVSGAQAGSYYVTVSNTTSTATSQTAVVALIAPSYIAYTNAGMVYAQNFDPLPDPGAGTVDTANPVTINGVTYALSNPFDFAYPVSAPGGGGLGLTNLAGWYGWAGLIAKFGASAGDQTTGGDISFGPTTSASTNRSLGLLATGTTGATAFAARILNQTGATLTNMDLSFTGELWRQQTSAKTISVGYYIDASGTNGFSVNDITATLPALTLSFATAAKAAGVDGPITTVQLGVTNQFISNCPSGAALWLVWEMAGDTSASQGLGIDNLSFSATGFASLSILQSNASVILAWPASLTNLALQYNNAGLSQSAAWLPSGLPVVVSNQFNTVTVPVTNRFQFFRLGH